MAKVIDLTLDFLEDLDLVLKNKYKQIYDYRILSKSLDARNAPGGRTPKYHYQIEILYDGDQFSIHDEKFVKLGPLKVKPIIIGAGPAGLFCALRLLEYGIPSILIERGERANKRMISIAKYWRKGILNLQSNVCFGEGGAGLFSDGKLITRIKSPYVNYIMKKLVEFGAPKEIAYYSNPHLGSNKIRNLIGCISTYLEECGCELFFETKVDDLIVKDKQINGVLLSDSRKIYSENVVLAIGHSAKDTFSILNDRNVSIEAKDFSIGVRVEHSRKAFDKLQYGKFADEVRNKKHLKSDDLQQNFLGASRYRLSYQDKSSNLGTYSFCMCPGGHVLSSGTEGDGLVTNGMSNFKRNSPWSNAAIVVEVKKGIHFKDDYKSAINFQQEIEKKAFAMSLDRMTGREIPAQRMGDFCNDKVSKTLQKSSCPSGLVSCDLSELLPSHISSHLKNSFINFDRKIKGFLTNDALLLAPETRTSSPIRITRNKQSLESINVKGLYPCGEGAGYAGGITSAAVDGVKCAMEILKKEKDLK